MIASLENIAFVLGIGEGIAAIGIVTLPLVLLLLAFLFSRQRCLRLNGRASESLTGDAFSSQVATLFSCSLGELIDDSLTAGALKILPAHQAVEAAREAAKASAHSNTKSRSTSKTGNPSAQSNVIRFLCRTAAGRASVATAIGLVSSSTGATVLVLIVILVAAARFTQILSGFLGQGRLTASSAGTDGLTVCSAAGFLLLGILPVGLLFAAAISRAATGSTA